MSNQLKLEIVEKIKNLEGFLNNNDLYLNQQIIISNVDNKNQIIFEKHYDKRNRILFYYFNLLAIAENVANIEEKCNAELFEFFAKKIPFYRDEFLFSLLISVSILN